MDNKEKEQNTNSLENNFPRVPLEPGLSHEQFMKAINIVAETKGFAPVLYDPETDIHYQT